MNNMGLDSDVARSVPLERVRNIGIMAHIDAGKTTLSERILYCTGVTWRLGEVHEGTATLDWMIQEQERGITITSAATTCPWKQHQINLIDMPGHVDFTAEVERSLRILDGVVAVFCGVDGVQAQTETVWRQADRYQVPVVAFVNKMDLVGADFGAVIREMRDRLGVVPVPVCIPWIREEAFCGVIDLISMEIVTFPEKDLNRCETRLPIPAEAVAVATAARRHLVECLAECDEAVLEDFLLDRVPSAESLWKALRQATRSRTLVPVVCGSAFRNQGVQVLLDLVVRCLPAPTDVRPIEGLHPQTQEPVSRPAGDGQPFAALVFKIMTDPRMGHVAFVRIYSGVARPGMPVLHSGTGASITLGRLLQVHANSYEERPAIFSGDIGALAETPGLRTGDTLCAVQHPILLEPARFPEPVLTMAVEPKSSQERDRLMFALRDLAHQDPTFRIRTDGDTGQTILAGMGELHLEVILDRMKREYGVVATVGRPQVARRTTVKRSAAAAVTIDLAMGAIRRFGSLELDVTPRQRGLGLSIDISVPETLLPREFHSAIRNGIHSAAEQGAGTGYPLVDLQVSVRGGSSLAGVSDALVFHDLAVQALEQAAKAAEPVILEPLMRVTVDSPPEFTGEVIGDVGFRHGQVTEVEAQPRTTRVTSLVPLACMFGYATALRSLTSGRAVFVSEFACYAEASEYQRNRKHR
jgi:elongation factor G